MSQGSEINALIRLLDDEDPEVFENVTNRILSYGSEVIPELENAWSDSANIDLHGRIEELIHILQFKKLKEELNLWINDDLETLLDGALLVAMFQFPDLDKELAYQYVDKARQKIWLELSQGYTPLENINIFNQVFYSIIGYSGVKDENIESHDFCLNHVLESKKGNAISLGILYIVLAQQLELPIYGVNLYRHFILAYQKNYVFDYDLDNTRDTIFFINPINKGVPFQRREIKEYIASMKIEEKESFFNPAANKAIIRELLYYLKFHLVSKGKDQKAEEISELIELFD